MEKPIQQTLTIFDEDPVSRRVLAKLLKSEGLEQHCTMAETPESGEETTGFAIFLGFKGNFLPAFSDISEENRIFKPVRVGIVLEIVKNRLKQSKKPEFINLGPYIMDCVNNELRTIETGAVIRLTEKEREILTLLATAGGAVDRKTLMNGVWGYVEGIETHTLETHIYRLRQKIEKDPAKPEILLTEETGYRINK